MLTCLDEGVVFFSWVALSENAIGSGSVCLMLLFYLLSLHSVSLHFDRHCFQCSSRCVHCGERRESVWLTSCVIQCLTSGTVKARLGIFFDSCSRRKCKISVWLSTMSAYSDLLTISSSWELKSHILRQML